ncbi:MAG TPA: fused MFS/spermidine synthase [Vicinamibacterales bacterium]|nr:fused MFS/spermidine synthase [Vicinamibacterales bacterium]
MTPRRHLPALFLLFVGSGCAALIYEIVWFQLLQLVIGSSSISLGILLGTFMGGMCLGSLLLPRLISARRHPLLVYGALELAIGVLALWILVSMPLIGGVYTAWAGEGTTGIVFRAVIAGICLLPPTMLMGATLPAISRWVKATPDGVAWLGFFYGGNIAGGVIGSLAAGFYLLRVFDVTTATIVAVVINIAVFLVATFLARRAVYEADEPAGTIVAAPGGNWAVYVAIALSGTTALSAEVIWTRLLSLHFGATVYTFALILAVFLVGLGIGSTVGASIGRTSASPKRALGWCQLFVCGAMGWAAYQLTESLPYWPINPSLASSPWFTMQLDFVRCMWVVLPGALLWGASFPLALAAVATTEHDAARLAGGVYAANTVGAIAGSLVTSFILIPWIGTSHAEQVVIIVSALSALLMLEPSLSARKATAEHAESTEQEKISVNSVNSAVAFSGRSAFSAISGTIVLALAMIAAGLLARSVRPLPGLLVAYGRYSATRVGQADIIYVGEGLNASVAVSELSNGVRNYHNAGKVQASSEPQDMRLQRMLGHLTTLIPANPKKVLVIGCGAGVTAGAVSVDPAVEHETIAEIEPLVPRVVSTYFAEHNFDVVRNPKVHVRIDDARHFVETTHEKFDAVTSDPLDPWVKGAAMLYTAEFFELVKQHLNPGGVVTLFVQLYESNTEAVKSEIGTFLEAFPNGVVFGNTNEGKGYDLVLLGQVQPTKIDVDAIQARLQRPEYAPMAKSLREIGMNSAVDLFATYAGRKPDLEPWLRTAQINHDRNLRLQYLAGLGLNLYQADVIYSETLRYVTRTPDDLFVASDQTRQRLFAAIQTAQGRPQ